MTPFSCSHDVPYLRRVYSSPDFSTDKELVKTGTNWVPENKGEAQSATGAGWF